MNYLENLITILGDKFSVSSVLDYIKTDSLINKDLYSKYLEIVKSRESGIYCEDDMVNQEVSEFLRVYTKLSTIHDKLKMLCEYGLSSDAIDIVLGQIADSDEIKSYYTTLGSSKLKSLSYNSAKIKNHLGVVTFSQELLESSIYSEFKVGDKITLSDIKSRLEVLYKSINYDKVAKAKDLENYFEVKNSSIYENGKKVKCYIIIKKKG